MTAGPTRAGRWAVLAGRGGAGLDTVTEEMVYRNLAAVRATTIVIAHRLSTVRNADLIIVMDGGRIAEAGTHRDLLALGGAWRPGRAGGARSARAGAHQSSGP